MKRTTVLALLAVAAVVLLLGVLEVLPLGLGGRTGSNAGEGDDARLTVDGEDANRATLEGLGKREERKADTPAANPTPTSGPAEVRGATPNGGSVRGRVVRARGKVPFAGVRVTLTRPDSIIAYLRAEANGRYDALEAWTGEDGRFAFLDVTPSKGYVVRAYHDDFAVASSDDDLDLSARAALDVGDLEMGLGATLIGRVVMQDQRPVPNARVVVTWRISNPLSVILSDPDMAPEIEKEARTGADGRFTIDRLDPHPKTVLVTAPSGAAQVVRSVSLEGGQIKALDDIVMPGPAVLAGTIAWQDGTPVTDARVFAAPQAQMAVRATTTDETGAFRLTWLPEGDNYVVGVLIPGLPVVLENGLSLGREDLRVVIPTPGRITGVAVTAEGRPVPRFALELQAAEKTGDPMMDFVLMQVRRGLGPTPFVDEAGGFSFPRVATGSYTLTLTAPGSPAVKTDAVVVTPGEATEVRIVVPRGHVARGRVLRSGGEPMKEARLYVIEGGVKPDAQGPALSGYIGDRRPDAVARGDGSFELPPQTPGRYDVIAAHPDVLAGVVRGVDLRTGDANDVRIDLPPSGSVAGLLYDDQGLPAQGEEVYVLYRNGVVRTETTDAKGRFEVGGLPTGRCLIRWVSLGALRLYQRYFTGGRSAADREKGYDELRVQGEEHEIVDGNTIRLALKIPPRTRVTGRFLVAGEVPPPERRTIYVTVEGGGRWISVALDDEGRFETRLESGPYLVYGPTSQNRYGAKPIVVPDAATFDVDVAMD